MHTLLLFDIDGTLVSGGPAKQAFHIALLEAFGMAGEIEVHDFSGKTDPQIARELLSGAGLSHPEIDARLSHVFDRYLTELEARLPAEPVRILPGVELLLEALTEKAHGEEVALGLVTGNVARGADLKLRSAGLREPFVVGGLGSDSEERNDLPRIALDRARDHWGTEFAAEHVWVIGDTPRDVTCAQAHGLRSLAVATGNFTQQQLAHTGADVVLADLVDTQRVVQQLVAR